MNSFICRGRAPYIATQNHKNKNQMISNIHNIRMLVRCRQMCVCTITVNMKPYFVCVLFDNVLRRKRSDLWAHKYMQKITCQWSPISWHIVHTYLIYTHVRRTYKLYTQTHSYTLAHMHIYTCSHVPSHWPLCDYNWSSCIQCIQIHTKNTQY